MPDAPTRWTDAFARLPMEVPPDGTWQRVSASLETQAAERGPDAARPRHARAGRWLALAAVLALAVAVPWRLQDTRPPEGPPASPRTMAGTTPAPPTLAELQAESAVLEALLAHARDGRVATGSAAAVAAELETRVAAIDAALADPALPPDREHMLWRERVEALQALASFEGTRRWLAANGAQYDAALVQVN